jgi:hypothetical protein
MPHSLLLTTSGIKAVPALCCDWQRWHCDITACITEIYFQSGNITDLQPAGNRSITCNSGNITDCTLLEIEQHRIKLTLCMSSDTPISFRSCAMCPITFCTKHQADVPNFQHGCTTLGGAQVITTSASAAVM